MKMRQIRTNTPVIRARVEFDSSVQAETAITEKMIFDKIMDEYTLPKFFEYRIKSISLRAQTPAATEVKFGVMGRLLYAVFNTNSLTASVNFEDNVLASGQPSAASVSAGDEAHSYLLGKGNDFPIANLFPTLEGEPGNTLVIMVELKF